MSSMIIVGWLQYFYSPPPDSGLPIYLPLLSISVLNFFGHAVDSISNPIIGFWSDRTRSPRGRRIPFLLRFTPGLALGFALIWFPPVGKISVVNILWLFMWIGVFWFSYTAVVAPYLSMHPEITPYRKERIAVSAWMALFELVGMILATVIAGDVIGRYKGGLNLSGIHFGDGYKIVGIAVAILIFITYYVPALTLKERPHSESKEVPFGFFNSIALCFKNPAFLPYIIPISLMKMAGELIIAIIPFLVKTVIWPDNDAAGLFHGMTSEAVAGIMQGVIVIVAVALFPLIAWMGGRFGKKKVVLGAFIWFGIITPFIATVGLWPLVPIPEQGLVILLLFAPAVSSLFVLQRPLIADIMDYDEKLTGYRREAMYNGVEGLLTKFASGVAPLIMGTLFFIGGYTAEKPWGILAAGPAAAVFGLIAAFVFRKYPFHD